MSELLGARYLRMNPYLNVMGCRTSMFEIADMAGIPLITGSCHGDDYIKIPYDAVLAGYGRL